MLERLKARRGQIVDLLAGSDMSAFPTNPAVRALTAELATVEGALVQAENTEAVSRASAEAAADRGRRDDEAYWFRQFMLSLQVGNGAGLLAVLSGVAKVDHVAAMARLAHTPATLFGAGVIVAGALPGPLWAQRHPLVQGRKGVRELLSAFTQVGAGAAAACFVGAIFSIVQQLEHLATG